MMQYAQQAILQKPICHLSTLYVHLYV